MTSLPAAVVTESPVWAFGGLEGGGSVADGCSRGVPKPRSAQVAVGEIRPVEGGIEEFGCPGCDAGQIRRGQVGVVEVRPVEVRTAEVSAEQLRTAKRDVIERRVSQICLAHVCHKEVDHREIDALEIGVDQVGVEERNAGE